MTTFERLALASLSSVRFAMGGSRRFVLDMAAKPDDYEMSPRQRWNLWRLAWSYRKQLPREVSDYALEVSAGMPAPPSERAAKAVAKARVHKTKYDRAREVLAGPLQFGNVDQARANRLLAPRWRRI